MTNASFRFADTLDPHATHWLWPDRIPRAALTLLVGHPGIGKSLLAADLTARTTNPRPWPDASVNPEPFDPLSPPEPRTLNPLGPTIPQSPNPSIPFPQGVAIASTDDRPEDALIPRLIAAGADLSKVCILDDLVAFDDAPTASRTDNRLPDPRSLIPALAEAIRAHDHPALVILDTLPALAIRPHGGLLALLAQLADLARGYGVAILATTHRTKTRGQQSTLNTVRGSLNYVTAARYVLSLVRDPSDPDARILLTPKSAYGQPPPPLRFRITAGPRLEWDEEPLGEMHEHLLDLPSEPRTTLNECADWLRTELTDGPRSAKELIHDANALGFSKRTLERAKQLLGVRAHRLSATGVWTCFPRPSAVKTGP